ncbi:hypothetical protein GCM10011391_35020 [Pullulanibacillus camelliae]|uniref:Uncharacterized protein n=1 Tax=Pullulanibacillus camelliae TaxID=1707096 RepID=A0A8J3E029_9BACL|nr:hypothetical protein [Pullulanibacillus camelliae]GGE53140.1 hypothetical protein GCM10011391_35020 [Pullulanibacillus camelliae]
MLKKWLSIGIVTLVALVLLGYKINQSHPELFSKLMMSKDKKESPEEIAQEKGRKSSRSTGENAEVHRDVDLEKHFPFNTSEEKKLAQKYPDQFNIVRKMYYYLDNIENAQGDVEWGDSRENKMRETFSVDYEKQMSLSKIYYIEKGQVAQQENVLFQHAAASEQLPLKHLYTKQSIKSSDIFTYLKVGQETIESQWYTLIYNDYPSWHYHSGTKFGMPVYLIEGDIPKAISEDLAGHFKMTVSQDTGALLSLDCYGHKNKVIYFVNARHLKINHGVSKQAFQLDFTGDKRVSGHGFLLETPGYNGGVKKEAPNTCTEANPC